MQRGRLRFAKRKISDFAKRKAKRSTHAREITRYQQMSGKEAGRKEENMATKKKKTVTLTLTRREVEALQNACEDARSKREDELEKELESLRRVEDKLCDIDTYDMEDDEDEDDF